MFGLDFLNFFLFFQRTRTLAQTNESTMRPSTESLNDPLLTEEALPVVRVRIPHNSCLFVRLTEPFHPHRSALPA